MKVILISFSDVHFKEGRNHVNNKLDKIVKAIKSRILEDVKIIFLMSGDSAFSGTKKEYELAFEFFSEIMFEFNNSDFLLIPGNHDCEFNDYDTEIRNIVINSIKNDSEVTSSTIEKVILQKSFNDYSMVFSDSWNFTKVVYENSLCKIVDVWLDDKLKIRVNLFNTAWCSKKNEKPGEMYMPLNMLECIQYDKDAILNISVIHHPTHWIEPNNKREFDILLSSVSDLIISGHEHEDTVVSKADKFGNLIHVEASVLQENWDESISGFNILELNYTSMEVDMNLTQFEWSDKDRMYLVDNQEKLLLDTHLKKISNLNIGDENTFLISKEMGKYLDEVDSPIKHPRISLLKFDDLYVYPDFKDALAEKENEKNISSESFFDKVITTDGLWFVEGENECGKSSYLKAITKNLLKSKKVPIYIESEFLKGKQSIDGIEKIIKERYNWQFEGGNFESFLQFEKKDKFLLIDHWERSNLNKSGKRELLHKLNKMFGKIIIMAGSSPNNMSDLIGLGDEMEEPIRFYEIKKFGFKKREELIEKWITIGNEYLLDENELSIEVDKHVKQVDEIIGKSYVPQMPIYILVILQSMDLGQDLSDFYNQSNGYYYELLLKQMINDVGIDNNESATLHNYLSHLAYKIFSHSKKSVDFIEWKEFHENYINKYELDPQYMDFKGYKERLLKCRILKQYSGERYSFNYNYALYFFTAQYLSNNISEQLIKEKILNLVADINIELNANVLIFLSHISKDDFILDTVINTANEILKDIPELKMEEDMREWNELIAGELPSLVFKATNTKENRQKYNEIKDLNANDEKHYMDDVNLLEDAESNELLETDVDNGHDEMTIVEKSEVLIEMDKAQRISEVIGQILKNYSGSILGDKKQRLLNSAYSVSLRAGANLIEILKDEKNELVSFISEQINEQKGIKKDNKNEVEQEAKRILFRFVEMVCFSIIQKCIKDTGSSSLKITYKKLEKNEISIVKKLVICGSYLETMYLNPSSGYIFETFNIAGKNLLAKSILQRMVAKYMYFIDLPQNDRQQIANAFGIVYDPVVKARMKHLKG